MIGETSNVVGAQIDRNGGLLDGRRMDERALSMTREVDDVALTS